MKIGSSKTMGVWNISEDNSYPLFNVMPSIATIVSPANSGSSISVTPLLDWAAGATYPPDSYNIYIGTTSGDLDLQEAGRLSTSLQVLSGLSYNTTYYWRVDSVDQNSIVTGTEWSFTTLGFAPPLPTGVTLDGDGEPTGTPTGINGIATIKRLVAAANNKIWYES